MVDSIIGMRIFLLSICFFISSSTLAQLDLVQKDQLASLKQELYQALIDLEYARDDASKFDALINLGDLYRSYRNYTKALEYYDQTLAFSNPVDDANKHYALQDRRARVFFANADYEEVVDMLEDTDWYQLGDIQYVQVYESDELLARALIQLGELRKAQEIFENLHEGALDVVQDTILAIDALVNASEVSNNLGQYNKTLTLLNKADMLARGCDTDPNVDIFLNRALAYNKLGRSKQAIAELLKAESSGLAYNAEIQKQIAQIYLNLSKEKDALIYINKAIDNAQLRNDVEMLVDLYAFRSGVEYLAKSYKGSLKSVSLGTDLVDKVRTKQITEESRRLRIQDFMVNVENEQRQNQLEDELKTSEKREAKLKAESDRLREERARLEKEKQEQELALLNERAAVTEANLKAAELERQRIEQEAKLLREQNKNLTSQRELEQLDEQRIQDSLRSAQVALEQKTKIELYAQNERIAAFEAAEQEKNLKRNQLAAVLLGLGLLIAGGLWFNTRRLNRKLATQNIKIEEQRVQVESERERAEQLLLNVLPKSIAEELKLNGIAAPEKYESASVLFTDFVGFTSISSQLAPEEIIEELNECFTEFDKIADRHRLEKIKTIGDSYMCAGGIPDTNDTHPSDAVKAGQDIVAFMNKRNRRHKAEGKVVWPIRIGIHTGELVAGVVGSSKFAYDIWGDTVNVASRMERGAEHDSINISEETYQLIKDHFDCQFRGEIDVKNKGLMGMYRVG